MTHPTHCDRCGFDCRYDQYSDYVLPTDISEVIESYCIWGVKYLCKNCALNASSFCNYWGVKKKQDLDNLRIYLQSGSVSKVVNNNIYSALTNAGYD